VEDYDSANDLLVVQGGGSVGIGTSSPGSYKLNVAGTSNFAGSMNLTTSSVLQWGGGDAKIAHVSGYNLAFYTYTGSSLDEHMRIDSAGDVTVNAGNLVIGTAGKGIDFSATGDATGMSSELLDDYEEGYITETITCEGSGGYNLNGSLNTLAYTKIGRVVHIQGSIQVDSENSPSGILQIDLPFTSASLTENSDVLFVPGFQLRNHGDAGLENCVLEIVASASKAAFHNFTDAGTKEGISESRVDTAFEMYFSFSYIAA
jgi:hypothetical protein